MKIRFLLVPITLMLLLSGCAATVTQLIGLPDEGRILVLELITAGLTFVLMWIGGLLKTDLGGFIQPLAAVVSPIIVTIIEHYLAMIPPAMDNLVLTIIHIIVLLVGSLGTWLLFRKIKARQSKMLLA